MRLAVDTSSHAIALALDTGRRRVWRDIPAGRDQAARLLPEILDFLHSQHSELAALTLLTIATGPGSFTGLRLGIAALQGVALAQNIPLTGCDNFTLTSRSLPSRARNARTLILLESLRAELYAQIFSAAGQPEAPAFLLRPEDIAAHMGEGAWQLAGSAATRAPENFHARIVPPEVPIVVRLMDTEHTNSKILPFYVRPPDVSTAKARQQHILRPLHGADAPWLAALHAVSFAHEHWDATTFNTLLTLPTTLGFAWQPAGQPVGFILFSQTPEEAEILTLAIAPAHQRQGHASAMLRAALAALPAQITEVHLEVAADNTAAQALYRALGFTHTRTRAGYYSRAPAKAMDALCYRWQRGAFAGAGPENCQPAETC